MSLVTAGSEALSAASADATSSAFVGRVTVALCALAQVILDEASATPHHDPRVAFAGDVQKNPQGAAAWVTWAVTSDMATGNASTDQEILDRIEALWNHLAGAL